jgi:CheY-like chemotaxis protein
MSRILFLDDDKTRHEIFRRRFPDHDIDDVYTAQGCINALIHQPVYDLVCLDHDLDGFTLDVEATGGTVAEFINLHLARDKYPKEIIIHSWNSNGAAFMKRVIAPTGIPCSLVPFRM